MTLPSLRGGGRTFYEALLILCVTKGKWCGILPKKCVTSFMGDTSYQNESGSRRKQFRASSYLRGFSKLLESQTLPVRLILAIRSGVTTWAGMASPFRRSSGCRRLKSGSYQRFRARMAIPIHFSLKDYRLATHWHDVVGISVQRYFE